MTTIYRVLLTFLLALLLISFFFPWGFAYRNGSIAALGWLGVNAMISDDSIIFSSNFLTVAYACIYLGMIFYRRWARTALVAISLLGGIAIPLFGISVQSGYEAMIGYFMTLGDGFIMAISFFSDPREKFSRG